MERKRKRGGGGRAPENGSKGVASGDLGVGAAQQPAEGKTLEREARAAKRDAGRREDRGNQPPAQEGEGAGAGGWGPGGQPEEAGTANSTLPEGAADGRGAAAKGIPGDSENRRGGPAGGEAAAERGEQVGRTGSQRDEAPRERVAGRRGATTGPATPLVENSAGCTTRSLRPRRGTKASAAEHNAFVEEPATQGENDGEGGEASPTERTASRREEDEDKEEIEEEEEEEIEEEEEEETEEEEEEEETEEEEAEERGGVGPPMVNLERDRDEEKPKTRIFEVVHWALRSILKMGMFSLNDAIGLWQLEELGTAMILTGQKRTAAGGQSCRLLNGSDIFRKHAPLNGNPEQMEQDGLPEWRMRTAQKEGILCYLKTVEHITKTATWMDKLMLWDHTTLRPLRKTYFGGLVVVPGPIVLDLRQGAPRVSALLGSTKEERLAALQRIAMPPRDGEPDEGHPRSELAFIFEYKQEGPAQFCMEDFASRGSVERKMQPFRTLLQLLKISLDDQRFLLKWLVLVLRRERVPVLMLQCPILSKLLLFSFISPAAVCTPKMHEALPNTSPAALSYVALQCSDLGMTLHASSPLCGIVQHRELHQARFDRNEVEFPAPPLLLDCAPGHIPSLAGGAAFVGGTVRVVRTGLDAAAYRKIDDEYQWNAASRKAVQHSVVFAAVFGAYLLEQDREQLMKPTSPPLLSELAPQAGKILEARLPFKKDDFRKVLLAVLESIEYANIFVYDPTDNKGVDLGMLCTVAFVLWAPNKWKTFCGFSEERKRWREVFDEVVQEAAKRGRADITRERMFQPGQRGSPHAKRIEALGSCSIFDAIAGPDKLAEKSGGQRVLRIQILPDELEAIFPRETLEECRTCAEGECSDGNGSYHLRDLCALKHRLARRKAARTSPLALFKDLKEKLEAQFVEEFPNESIPFEDPDESAEAIERYVKQLTDDILRLRQQAAAQL